MGFVVGFVSAEVTPDFLFEFVVLRRGGDAGEVAAETADSLVDADAVVVENDEDVGFGDTGVVESLESLTTGHGAVADDGNMLPLGVALQCGSGGHAEGSTDGGGAVASAKGVEGRLVDAGETAKTAIRAYGWEKVATTGDDFVGVGLVADIPDEFVVGGVEDVVEGEGEFDSAKRGGEMTRVECEGMDDVVTQFETELFEVGDGECPEVVDGVDAAEDDAGEFVGAL